MIEGQPRYQIKAYLGSGRAGSVYLADDLRLGRLVMLRKFIQPSGVDGTIWCDQLFTVLRSLAEVQHSNVQAVYDVGMDQDGPFLVSAHIEGRSVIDLLSRGRVSVNEVRNLSMQVLEALEEVQKHGFYHYSMGLTSLLVTPSPSGNTQYVLRDLGYSKLMILCNPSTTLQHITDPAFLAPEVYMGNPQGVVSTFFMLGQLCYTLLAGRHPLASMSMEVAHAKHCAGEMPHLRSIRGDIPESFQKWLYKMMRPMFTERPQSVSEALALLPSLEELAKTTLQEKAPTPMSMPHD